MSSNAADIKNPQTSAFDPKLSSMNVLKSRNIITVGIVAMIRWRLVVLNG